LPYTVRHVLLNVLAVLLLAAPASAAAPDFRDAGGLHVTSFNSTIACSSSR
jgi:hypothetical protein